jgi:dipeptidyl aminopeptidase/acylaminoacyl peptidase
MPPFFARLAPFLFIFSASGQEQKTEQPDLAALLALPFVESIAGDISSTKVAWVENQAGTRRIRWAESIDLRVSKILLELGDNGEPISDLTVAPRGSELSYTLGNKATALNKIPNPDHKLNPEEQSVWLWRAKNAQHVRLGKGHSPSFSPDATLIAWLYKGQLFLRAVADPASNTKPKTIFTQPGVIKEFRWSPDGKRIAYQTDRGRHSWIGVFELKPRALRYIDPGFDRDISPQFSPDGQHIAFIRYPGLRHGEYSNLTVGVPFSVRIADVATGKGRTLWQSPGADGGYAQWGVDSPLAFVSNTELVFASEHEHWARLYRLAISNSAITPITPAYCEVEQWRTTNELETLLFTSNCFESEGRQITRVNFNTGNLLRLNISDRVATDPILLDGGQLAFRSSGPRTPTRLGVIDLKNTHKAQFQPNQDATTTQMLVTPKSTVLQAQDGTGISVQIFDKPNPSTEKRPAIIYLHGGPMRQMLPAFHYLPYYHRAYAMNQFLAQKGYVVICVNFRSGIGYGRTFRLAPNQGPRGMTEYQDVLAAAAYLKQRNDIDSNRIGIWGGSYGGYLTAWALAHNSETFAAGVDLHGVHDWVASARNENGTQWGISEPEYALAAQFSPSHTLDAWKSPILLIHGDADSSVSFNESIDLAQKLRSRGVAVDTLAIPNEEHSFLLHKNWLLALQTSADFFDRLLKPKQ